MNSKTPEELAALKANWLHDPVWDIEDTEGFEAHRDELAAYHQQKRAEWDAHHAQVKAAKGAPVPPSSAQELSSAQSIGLMIIARLAIDGFLKPHFVEEMTYVIDAIAEELSHALEKIPGGANGDLDKVLHNAGVGEVAERRQRGAS